MTGAHSHQPVLLDEVMDALKVRPEGYYIDATFGRGGHSAAILGRLNEQGRLLALDRDPQAIAYGRERFADEPRIEFEHINFNQVADVLAQRQLESNIDGVLMDLGVSSPQLDDAGRGFSFMHNGPLDMRMDTTRGESASEWLARVELEELVTVLKQYGEEKFARRIAHGIIEARQQQPITETAQLVSIIEQAMPVKEKHKHPATRSFQAIRMHINQELQSIETGLEAMLGALKPGGRLAVISFHSIEDRLVKRFMKAKVTRPVLPKNLPVFDTDEEPPYRLAGKPQTASPQELENNPRARSARLRVLERVR